MIRIAIVEDEQECARQMKEFLTQYGRETGVEMNIKWFSYGINFISDYTADFDLVFMDIDMPHMNGLDTAKLLRQNDEHVSLIFVTNLARYAIKGYEVGASNFIVKPLEYKSFCTKIEKVISAIKQKGEAFLVVNSRNGKSKVYYSDIFYITVDGRYVVLHTRGGEVEMHVSMREIEKMLSHEHFVRGDNSSMVNLMYVTAVNADGAIVNGQLIPCSRNRRKALLDAFTLYLR